MQRNHVVPYILVVIASLAISFGAARAEMCFNAVLDGAQAGTPSPGTGVGKFVLSDDELTLTYNVTFSGLGAAETASHIHSDAEGGGIVRNLATGSPKIGEWKSSDAQAMTPARVANLKAGLLYVNVHSTAFPAGEIRGQILPTACTETCYEVGSINGANAGTPSAGTGFARVSLNHTETELAYWIEYSGLTTPETVSHIHSLAEGGGVVHPLVLGSPKKGVWKFTDVPAFTAARVQALKNGQLYVNIHSSTFPAGEIAGPILPGNCQPQCFDARLDGAQAGTTSIGKGAGHFVLSHARERLSFNYTITGVVGETVSHIHNQNEGGAVMAPTGVGQSKSGEWDYNDAIPLTTARVIDTMNNQMYVNVHTTANPAGDIRGQMLSVPCVSTGVDDMPVARTTLHQNHPNPFNPATVISFELAAPEYVRLDVFDVAGRRVATLIDGRRAAGPGQASWDGRDTKGNPVSSGVYFYRLLAGGTSQTKKMVLLK